MSVPAVVLIGALLLTVIAFAEPAARALRLPTSVVLAMAGIAMGIAASLVLYAAPDGQNALARFLADPPLPSAVFIYLFLPLLLFQSALGVDVPRLIEDATPIFILAVVAVVTATLAIGLALWPVAGVGLAACLLLGAIVATTDPVAVIGIFRAVGAPERLVGLVEGESLLNDAAAITMFVVFSAMITAAAPPAAGAIAVEFLVLPLGGAVAGLLAGVLAAWVVGRIGDEAPVEITLSVTLPYAVFILAEQVLHVSGVIAVVAAGLAFAHLGPAKTTPATWRTLRAIWSQLDFWASMLLFLLASLLVPRLMAGATLADLGLLFVVVLAATAARWAIVYGFLPLLARMRGAPPLSPAFAAVVFWGGLRGATTLALALAVTEDPAMPADVARMVAVLATGYTLFTLLVQGTTLRPLMRRLGLDRLTPVDAAVRDEAVALARSRVGSALADVVARSGLASEAAGVEIAAYGTSAAQAGDGPLPPEARAATALVSLARHERETVLALAGDGVLPPAVAARFLGDVRSMLDGARLGGVAGWTAAVDRSLAFDRRDRFASAMHRRFGIERFLAARIERRIARLVCARLLLSDLRAFAAERVLPLAGPEAAATEAALAHRESATRKALDALRLQYPDYAAEVEVRLVRGVGRAMLAGEMAALVDQGLVNGDVGRDLTRSIGETRAAGGDQPRFDLSLDPVDLVGRTPLFAGLEAPDRALLARRLRPVFAYPGETLIRRGERGDAAYFVASGAVEVDTGRATFLIGRGGVFGEMSMITGEPRSGTVASAGFSALLRLSKRDFDAVMSARPDVRRHLEDLAAERRRINAEADPS
jgi:CPA1 family monovalent cation:H+ antiporter